LAYPGADIYTITDSGFEPTKYEESMPYLLTKQFILNRERILDELLGDEE
jgi:predicted ATPase